MDCTNIIGEKIKSLRTNQEISNTGTGRTRRADRGTGKSH